MAERAQLARTCNLDLQKLHVNMSVSKYVNGTNLHHSYPPTQCTDPLYRRGELCTLYNKIKLFDMEMVDLKLRLICMQSLNMESHKIH